MRLKRRDLCRNPQLWRSSDGAKRDPRGARHREDARAASALAAAQLLPLLLRSASATEPDLAFGVFQTSFLSYRLWGIAINRIELKEDPKAMTPSGELYTGSIRSCRSLCQGVSRYSPLSNSVPCRLLEQ